MTALIITAIVGFIIYWIFIKDGAYKQGVGEFRNGDLVKASGSFHKAIRKNPQHFKAEFHLGLYYKDQAELFEATDTRYLQFKKNALKHLIRATEINPDFDQANNLVEYIIGSEKNNTFQKDLLEYSKLQIKNSKPGLQNEYSWLYNI